MNRLVELYNTGLYAEARAAADAVLGDATATTLEKAIAARAAAQAAMKTDQPDTAIGYYQQAIDLDALDNKAHFAAMRNLAMLQQQQGQLADSLMTYERYFASTGSTQSQDLAAYGNSLYQAGRYADAAETIAKAIDASPSPDPQWDGLLMQAQLKAGNSSDALQVAERMAAASPDDKRAQKELAIIYQRNAMPDQAVAVLEKLRSLGQFDQAADYLQLASIYIGLQGREQQAIDTICSGIQTGVLEPDVKTLEQLARLYFLSEQFAPSIVILSKLAPLDPGGDVYLDLAALLFKSERLAEAQDAAREALARGLSKDDDKTNARNILTHVVPGKGAGSARRRKASTPETGCATQAVETFRAQTEVSSQDLATAR